MKLKDLEKDITMMENTVEQMKSLNQGVSELEDQLEVVKQNLEKEIHNTASRQPKQ